MASNSALPRRLYNNYSAYRYLLLTALVTSVCLVNLKSAQAEVKPSETEIQARNEKLTGDQILQIFADVRDDARVQDAARTRAVNHWHSDGRFISRWKNAAEAGEVTGTWRVKNNMRCVTITKGLPQRIGKESCGNIFKRGNEYLSFNRDGSIHGIHTLTPLSD